MDIANLGLSVDSGPVTKADKALDDFAGSAKNAQAAATGLEGATEQVGSAMNKQATAAKSAAAAEKVKAAADKAAAAASNDNAKAMRQLTWRRQQFLYQSNDVISGLIMGQSPMMVATQQGGQLAQVYGGKGGLANAASDAANMIRSLTSRLGPIGLAVVGAGAAVAGFMYIMNRGKEEVLSYDDALSELEGALKAASDAHKLAIMPAEELRATYGGSKQDVDAFVQSLVTLSETQTRNALKATAAAFTQEEAYKRIVNVLNTDAGNSGVARINAIRTMTAELGITEDQARAVQSRFEALSKADTFEKQAEEARTFVAFIETLDAKIKDKLLPTITEFEGIVRKGMLTGQDGAKELAREVEAASSAYERLSDSAERAAQGRLRADGKSVELINRRMAAEKAALDEVAKVAIDNGADVAEVTTQLYQAKIDLEYNAQAEILEIQKAAREKSAKAREADAKKAESEIKARNKLVEQLSSKQDAFAQARLKSEGKTAELITARLEAEKAALDELAQEAIAAGAEQTAIWEQVAQAKRDAGISAAKEIADYELKRIADTVAADKKAQDEKARYAESIKRLKAQNAQQDLSLGLTDISSSPFAGRAGELGAGAEQGIAGALANENSELTKAQENHDALMQLYATNNEAKLQLEAEFQRRKQAIQEQSLQTQAEVIKTNEQLLMQSGVDALSNMTTSIGAIMGEQSDAYRAFLIAQKAAALAQAAIAAPAAIAEAMKLPFPMNFLQAGVVAANVAAQVAAIKQVAVSGREHGGPVSRNQMYEIGEKNKPEVLQMGGKNYMIPGNDGRVYNERQMTPANDRAGGMNVKIVNNGGVKVRTERRSDGELMVMIDEAVSRGIQTETPGLVAGQIRNPSSKISRTLGSATKTARRRP